MDYKLIELFNFTDNGSSFGYNNVNVEIENGWRISGEPFVVKTKYCTRGFQLMIKE